MAPAHFAKKEAPVTSNGGFSEQIKDAVLQEPASWLQALIMFLPIVGYLITYYMKYYRFSGFGISADLITIRLEDVLLYLIIALVTSWSYVLNWGVWLIWDKNRLKTIVWITHYILILAFLYQAFQLVSISIKCGVVQVGAFITLATQAALLVMIVLSGRKRWGKVASKMSAGSVAYSLVMSLFFIILTIGQCAYLSFHLGKYQKCTARNAIIVGYDAQGRGIAKEILEERDDGFCRLASGYELYDICEQRIEVKRYTYIATD